MDQSVLANQFVTGHHKFMLNSLFKFNFFKNKLYDVCICMHNNDDMHDGYILLTSVCICVHSMRDVIYSK